MREDRIHVVDTLDEATALLQRLSKPGDVVLFANDLPDTYLPAARNHASDRSHRLRLGDNRPGPRAAATFHFTSQPAFMHCPSSTEHAS